MIQLQQPSVAVIGLGAQGLVTVKNILEQGFQVTGFDQNDYIGGLWHYTKEPHQVSALLTTTVNISRERACFSDFAFPDGTDSHPTAAQVEQYLHDFVDHFQLWPHLRLSTVVQAVVRDESGQRWKLRVSSTSSSVSDVHELAFDKVVVATGPEHRPMIPDLPGKEAFQGEILHSKGFKDPHLFRGKSVVVVGASNSAADTATSLVGIANKVYFAHRRGLAVLPRYLNDGRAIDHTSSYRMFQIQGMLDKLAPKASGRLIDYFMSKIQNQAFGPLELAWRMSPTPSSAHRFPAVTDALLPALRAGTVISTHAPKRVAGDFSLELDDGTVLSSVDCIVYCTGYTMDYTILGELDPTVDPLAPGGHQYDTPRLYQNIFSFEYPDSLAFIGALIFQIGAFLLADLSSMAVAQLWSRRPGTPVLPPLKEMEQSYSDHLAWVNKVRARTPQQLFLKQSVRSHLWLPWVTEMAGCNLDPYLGVFRLQSWRLWWSDRQFHHLMAYGIMSPHLFRVFESSRPHGRKKWDGARQAIERVNADSKTNMQRRKAEKTGEKAPRSKFALTPRVQS